MMQEMIIYDQPLNEVIRVALRLEQLFKQIDHQLTDTSLLSTRNVIVYIINVLQLLERPDLKAKLAKELSALHASLLRYSHQPGLDDYKFKHILTQLDDLSRLFIESSGKIGHRLRDIELLNTLRLQLASPGGGCSFDLPLYHYWLQQPLETRQQTINDWLSDFRDVRTATTLILELVRNHAKLEERVAVHGFYQELLDAQSHLRMIRLMLPEGCEAFPEMSIGRHFMSVRLYTPDIYKRPVQYAENLTFMIAYCNP